MTRIARNTTVRLGHRSNIPLRYQGRTATVLGRVKAGRGFKFELDLGTRRVNPLTLPASSFTVLD